MDWKSELTKVFGSTALHYAASINNLQAVKLLLKKDRASAYVADSSTLFPVHVAAKLGCVEVLTELFKELHLAIKEEKECSAVGVRKESRTREGNQCGRC